MGFGILLSGLLHFFLVILLMFGLPNWKHDLPESPQPIPIELLPISELSVAPAPQKSLTEKPKPQPKEKTEPEPEPEPEPSPAPEPEPEPELIPEPETKPELKPETIAEPEVKEPPLKKSPALASPPEKPKSPEVEEKILEKKKEKPKKSDSPKKEEDFLEDIEKALNNLEETSDEKQPDKGEMSKTAQPNEASLIGDELSMSELDALKRQFRECWTVPNGMKEAKDLVVELKVSLNPDATVREAAIVDLTRYHRDHQFKTAADAARRAVLNPKCNPLKIPLSKYEALKAFVFKFDPREMF